MPRPSAATAIIDRSPVRMRFLPSWFEAKVAQVPGARLARMLKNVKVLDLSRVLAGPYCTQLLADMGADVIKVESPTGDDTRRWGPPYVGGESGYYLSVNRGKRSLAVDLKDAEAAAAVKRIAGRADVVIENFKVGDLARYGLDYESVSAVNPKVVYMSITGFRSEEHTSELQSRENLVCRLLLEKKKKK